MSTFDGVSGEYKQKSLVQAAAAEKLIARLKIGGRDDVLDAGCGPGHITQRIRELTTGRVEGTDISHGMIEQAKVNHPEIFFRTISIEELDYKSEFDVVFCNSTFQWVKDARAALSPMYNALRPGGLIGIACPATEDWSVCFRTVAEEAGRQPDTRDIFSHWHSPWCWLPDEKYCRKLFESCGFEIKHLQIEKEITSYTADQAFANFISGAAQGYTGKTYYDIPLTDEYIKRFRTNAEKAMHARQKDGKVEVDFNRLYFVGSRREV
jgi:trans-aconitate methyltransferase